ncbi:MAG: hypothetical protein HY646_10705 [Acidobacteria bacterium]|nr:hypothetical protein [Acidobacteriota bacterium]
MRTAILLLFLLQNIEKVIDRDPVIRVLPRDAIPAIDTPTFLDADAAARFMRDDEIVISYWFAWKAFFPATEILRP